jgi:hypothetical protein
VTGIAAFSMAKDDGASRTNERWPEGDNLEKIAAA